ncbi:MAG TPA: hypothetical protein VF785_04725 [Gemmatimonadaceae bacterium]
MKSKQTRGLQAFRRIEAWFAEHPQVLAAAGSSAAAVSNQLDALKQLIVRMSTWASQQVYQNGQATLAAKDEAQQRHEVRLLHLTAIVRVAAGLRGKVPGMGVFKLPNRSLSSDALVHAAEAIRTTAAVYKDVFVEHGLPADFLDQLDAATTALGASVDARGVARSRVTGASSGLASDLVLGRQIVTMIDASLTHALKADPATLASWRQVKRPTVKGAVPRKAVEVNPAVAGGAPVANGGAPVGNSSAPAAAPGVSVSNTAVPAVSTEGSETVGSVTPAIPSEFKAA